MALDKCKVVIVTPLRSVPHQKTLVDRSTVMDVASASQLLFACRWRNTGRWADLITGTKAKRSIVKFVAAMRIHTPFIWALGHDEETSTFPMLLVQSTQSPQA